MGTTSEKSFVIPSFCSLNVFIGITYYVVYFLMKSFRSFTCLYNKELESGNFKAKMNDSLLPTPYFY